MILAPGTYGRAYVDVSGPDEYWFVRRPWALVAKRDPVLAWAQIPTRRTRDCHDSQVTFVLDKAHDIQDTSCYSALKWAICLYLGHSERHPGTRWGVRTCRKWECHMPASLRIDSMVVIACAIFASVVANAFDRWLGRVGMKPIFCACLATVAALIALVPIASAQVCNWGDGTSTPQSVFAAACARERGKANGCSCDKTGGGNSTSGGNGGPSGSYVNNGGVADQNLLGLPFWILYKIGHPSHTQKSSTNSTSQQAHALNEQGLTAFNSQDFVSAASFFQQALNLTLLPLIARASRLWGGSIAVIKPVRCYAGPVTTITGKPTEVVINKV
jgi:hypothetical protein